MQLSDALSGALAVALGAAVVAYAQTFPPMPGQNVGPSLFPSVIGGGMMIFGCALMVPAIRRGERLRLAIEDWMYRPRMVLNFALVIGLLVFYALAVDTLGFFITSILFLSSLFLAFGVGRRWIVPLAFAVTFAIHYAFYSLLRVPLPWGLFEAIAW
ncbi:MAG: tripartite tricarboxylate transporter TctB family protein [Burkholderiales bacterium]